MVTNAGFMLKMDFLKNYNDLVGNGFFLKKLTHNLLKIKYTLHYTWYIFWVLNKRNAQMK